MDFLIPHAHAQFTNQARQAANAAEEGGQAGIQELFSFVANNFDNWIAGVVVITITWIIAKLIAKTIKKKVVHAKGDEIHESVLVLIERVTTISILAIGVTIAAAINGLNFTAVLGALSLGIGFALKDIIGNFISGILMLSQNRIRIGDLIKVGDIIGTIVNIDTRATILQAIDGTEVVIPNQSMLNETLISYSTNPFRRIELIIGVDYKTDLPMVTSVIKGIIDQNSEIVPKPESQVLVQEFGDSSINIRILFWVESNKNWMKIRSNLANKIRQAFGELHINIPFPIRTLKVDEDDRALLKTMQSLKKGYVPEAEKSPTQSEGMNAAKKAANLIGVPEKWFNNEEKKKDETREAQKPIEPPTQSTKEIASAETPKAPPSHL